MDAVMQDVDELTVSDHAQIEGEPVGAYLNQDDCDFVATYLEGLTPEPEDKADFDRLLALLRNAPGAESAYHVRISDPG